jgi:hypothetical protein
MLELFIETRKPLNLDFFRNERKPMLGLIFKVKETNKFDLLSK